MATLGRAIAIAAVAFQHKTDKGGRPYMEHLIYVMLQQPEHHTVRRICSVLHDLKEDCPDWTNERLIREGFSEQVIEVLDLLTHDPEMPYEEYIERISTNKDAVAVKLADLRHNSDITRMKGLRPKDIQRLEKYHKAFARLRDIPLF